MRVHGGRSSIVRCRVVPLQRSFASEGLSLASFYGWRSKLRHDAGSGSVSAAEKPRPAETHSSRFIDLGALGMSGPRIEVRLELGGGVALQLVRG
jgi:hypothetical protein